jgi:hypothetical protein
MKAIPWAVALTVLAASAWADQRTIDADPATDFSAFRTFSLREGKLAARAPELNSPLTRKKIDEGIRAALSGHGLSEVPAQPDLLVQWRFGAADKREIQTWAVGRWGRGRRVSAYNYTEGTLIVDLYERSGRELVWRGIYRDDESHPDRIASRIGDDIKKLFKDFPPKVKK